MQYTPNDFFAKWFYRFRPGNVLVEKTDFQEFVPDLKDTFGEEAVNVPPYVAGTTYAEGNLVRFAPSGGQEGFYYALKPGKLASPQGNFTDWKEVGKPLPATELAQSLTLVQAQGLDQTSVKAGREYLIDCGPDAQGATQTICVRGVSNDCFDVTGTLEVAGVRTPITAFDVQAGTWQDATLDTSNLVNLTDDQTVNGVKTWLKHLLVRTNFAPIYQGADPSVLVTSEGFRWVRANKLGQPVAQLAYNFNDDILELSAGQVTVPVPVNGNNAARKDDVDAVATLLPGTTTRTADYTLQLSDAGHVVPVASASTVLVTVPTHAAVAFPLGTIVFVSQFDAGRVAILAAAGVTIRTLDGYYCPGQWGEVGLRKIDFNTWQLKGATT